MSNSALASSGAPSETVPYCVPPSRDSLQKRIHRHPQPNEPRWGPRFEGRDVRAFYKHAQQSGTPACLPLLFCDQHFLSDRPDARAALLDFFWLDEPRTRFVVCSRRALKTLRSVTASPHEVFSFFAVEGDGGRGFENYAARYRGACRLTWGTENVAMNQRLAHRILDAGRAALKDFPGETMEALRPAAQKERYEVNLLVGRIEWVGFETQLAHELTAWANRRK